MNCKNSKKKKKKPKPQKTQKPVCVLDYRSVSPHWCLTSLHMVGAVDIQKDKKVERGHRYG
jgi:hypothetical protein